jgi:hypothetical protein
MGGDVDRSNFLASSFVVEVYGLFVSKLTVDTLGYSFKVLVRFIYVTMLYLNGGGH